MEFLGHKKSLDNVPECGCTGNSECYETRPARLRFRLNISLYIFCTTFDKSKNQGRVLLLLEHALHELMSYEI